MENTHPDNGKPVTDFEQNLVNRIAWEAVAEQRRARRWGIFFKFFFAGYLILFLLLYLPASWYGGKITVGKHTALIDIEGVIGTDSEANADYIVSGLRAAFEDKNTAGVILRINSPGGSPVQAGYVNDEIKRLRELYPDIPLYAVIADICASGGYYIAAAAEKIYANKASIVGSIGVIMSGFGFVDAIHKLGIERRLITAGESKGFLDPFSPQKSEDVEHIDGVLNDVYQQFIDVVKAGRGDRLKSDDKIFSGLIWSGEESIDLGLVDALGSAGYVAREVIGAEDIVDFTLRDTYFERFARQVGTAVASAISSKLELR
ncbi:MAG: peptidase S49 [Gammaproteobacteria bacterium RIFCSPLOWO2_02_FULL_47_50]|nr:MAG: peptidase S49 [Gammaproteobacteria bacterium RIFCSPLOWO2_01_FULL_47_190]OGT71627.1 MAG: peptidase S49 [Gammaproteobacteria bacterium RIFCSPLOWO2_12_47_11]OGT80877.1 MAG: peptidase S49 [Gammaproteobacteria bacterium RIFCSPLOWO2_02_FULL_47_50]OGT83402.1 MAG: peptidase S49 [Gammaproteobacteria bacterium RIFCSPLOWO2_12_FULL_47_76]